tara:strand:- start:230 stop:403 length:174 start_codon:yes stop_codon:yes gene_type:complete
MSNIDEPRHESILLTQTEVKLLLSQMIGDDFDSPLRFVYDQLRSLSFKPWMTEKEVE